MSNHAAATALRQQGVEALKSGRLDEAIAAFSRLLQLNPDQVEALAGLAAAYSQKGLHEPALQHYDRCLRLRPTSAALHYNRGLALERAGKRLAAAEAYEEAMRVDPQHAPARQRLQLLEQAFAGGPGPVATPSDSLMPVSQPDDDLPVSTPSDSMLLKADRPMSPAPPTRSTLGKPATAEASRPAPRPADPAPSRPSTPPLWDAGSKAKAAAPMVAPQKSPAAPIRFNQIEEEVLDVLPADAPVAAPSRPPGETAELVLAEGERFDAWVPFVVSECDQDHLTLRSKSAGAMLWIVAAPVCLLLAGMLVWFLITGLMDGERIRIRGIFGLIVGLIFVVGLCITAIYKLLQIGMNYVVDASSATIERSRWFGLSRAQWHASELKSLRFVFNEPDDDGDQNCQAILMGSDGFPVLELGKGDSAKESTGVLLTVAVYVARMLRLPLKLEGTPHKPCAGLREVHGLVSQPGWERTTKLEPTRGLPRTRKDRTGRQERGDRPDAGRLAE